MATEQNPDQNPTMDEILASIRKIVSTDGRNGDSGQDQPIASFAETQQGQTDGSTGDEDEDQVLDLTDALPDSEPLAPSPVAVPPTLAPAAFTPAPTPVMDPVAENKIEERVAMSNEFKGLVSDSALSAASAAFNTLQSEVTVSRSNSAGRTLEDIVVELMRPMIKEWLDTNLTEIVDEAVRAEIERISKRRPGSSF
ncbi:MAG: DUF2497 domain-containing protein [Parvibaculaceae bacterium]|nr:DUF2497 domain-containing protein [Parvibaculaceae bacterium]